MKSSKIVFGLIVFSTILFNCKNRENQKAIELEAINDVFLELVRDRHLYQDLADFTKEYYLEHLDSISEDSMNILYNKNKKVLKYSTLILKNELVPLAKDEKEILSQIDNDDPSVEYKGIDSSIPFDFNHLTNKGYYNVIPGTEGEQKIGNETMAIIRFSRVHFNKEMNKAAFSFEIYCGELCYSRGLILISKDSDGKWIIIRGYPLEVA